MSSLKIACLPIVDHLILGLSISKNTSVDVCSHMCGSWKEIADSFASGEVDGAFVMAPRLYKLVSEGVQAKSVLLGHRDGLCMVVRQSLGVKSLADLKGKTIGVPSLYSTHHWLLHAAGKKAGLDIRQDFNVMPTPPTEMVEKMKAGELDGYVVSEPFGTQAEDEGIGEIFFTSCDIKRHHIDCVLVFRTEVINQRPNDVQKIVDLFVETGSELNNDHDKIIRPAAKFLKQKERVVSRTLERADSTFISWDLYPIRSEYKELYDNIKDEMQLDLVDIDFNELVDDSFAQRAYRQLDLKRKKRESRKALWAKISSPIFLAIFLLAVWEGLVRLLGISEQLLPGPFVVASSAVELWGTGKLLDHIAASLWRIFCGFSLAGIVGVTSGIIFGWWKRGGDALMPIIQLVRPISPIAWIPLAILWFGIGDAPAIFIIFITSFFPIFLSTSSAVREVNEDLVKTAINFGANGRRVLLKVILPASLPYIFIGLRIALGFAWMIIVAAEMVGMRSGLGYMILDARNLLRTDWIIAGMFIIGVIGLILDTMMSSIETFVRKKMGYKG